jgi:hypothetical protein
LKSAKYHDLMRILAFQPVSTSAFQEEQNQAAFHEMPVFF